MVIGRLVRAAAGVAALLSLAACVYEPGPPPAYAYGAPPVYAPTPGYYPAPGYYAQPGYAYPPIVGSVNLGFGGWGGRGRWR